MDGSNGAFHPDDYLTREQMGNGRCALSDGAGARSRRRCADGI